MEKTYSPHEIEQRWYEIWEKQGYFTPKGQGKSYCIMIPPPNVTGTLHMGHAFQDTIMDILTRYHRMQGDNTLWQAGTDHAGIATQMVVERQLAAQGKSRHDVGREKFIEKVWEWKAQSGGRITEQLRYMGSSLDWINERFTMDEGLSQAVREVFVRLYDEGLIYRGKRLVNYDPVLHTAVSDLEVISEEEQGSMWNLRYPLSDGSGDLIVATTRPETMLGDTAVAVHPKDERYKHLIGKSVNLPLTNRVIPIIADDYVDPEFGSGCVKITPAHDFNDYAIGQRHHLPLINIFTEDAKINENAPAYQGLDRFEARKKVVADLKKLGLLVDIKPHKLMVPRGDRSHAIIEPYLTNQWYVKIAPLAKPAIEAVENGNITFIPDNWRKTYFEWMRNIEDWCISRQIWWGHRIPAWYDEKGTIYVGHSETHVREKYKLLDSLKLKQDEDVLDTWFSSALWPFSTLGWPEKTERLNTFYPTSVLVTGFDIIFFWVARMIMMGLKFMDDVPFREVYIHGLIRDADGQKMSKSKGNVLDPLDLIEGIDLESLVAKRTTGLMQPEMAKKIEQSTRNQYPDGIPAFGSDALRFTFSILASTGRDIRFDLGRIEGYRNFCNKLWNATRYVLMNTENQDTGLNNAEVELSLADRWILSHLQLVIKETHQHICAYRFDLAAQTLYEFTWNEYCDWYLEFSKVVLQEEKSPPPPFDKGGKVEMEFSLSAFEKGQSDLSPFEKGQSDLSPFEKGQSDLSHFEKGQSDLPPFEKGGQGGILARRGTRRTLVQVLESLLKLLHPFMPFITEELWQRVAPLAGVKGETIMLQTYPQVDASKINDDTLQPIEWIKQFILGVRKIRAEMDIAPSKRLSILLQNGSAADHEKLQIYQSLLSNLARLEDITWLSPDVHAPESAIALVGEMRILIPLAGLIDKEAELKRLDKEITKLRKELEKSVIKMNNPQFTDRAPAPIVEKERQKLTEMETALYQLEMQQAKISAI